MAAPPPSKAHADSRDASVLVMAPPAADDSQGPSCTRGCRACCPNRWRSIAALSQGAAPISGLPSGGLSERPSDLGSAAADVMRSCDWVRRRASLIVVQPDTLMATLETVVTMWIS